MANVKNTASRKMTDMIRGAVAQGFTAFTDFGFSFLVSKLAPRYIRPFAIPGIEYRAPHPRLPANEGATSFFILFVEEPESSQVETWVTRVQCATL
jgi:hypothetical protein